MIAVGCLCTHPELAPNTDPPSTGVYPYIVTTESTTQREQSCDSRATPHVRRSHTRTPRFPTFAPMMDTALEMAKARAVLTARTAPDLRLLRAVHTGLVALPVEIDWDAADDDCELTIRRRVS